MNRDFLKDKKRIVVKIGTSTITHVDTGHLNLLKMEKLTRVLTDIRNQDKEIVLVSSGAIGAGRKALGIKEKPRSLSKKQACAAVGQARLMMIYQKLFAEYNQTIAQILITKRTMINEISRRNAENTFHELLNMGVIPIVNENDTVSTDQIQDENFGDNDTLSATVAQMVQADMLILLSDIDGLYTDDPRNNEKAEFVSCVEKIDDGLCSMAKGADSAFGTGGMTTKIAAAKIANEIGVDMVIANGNDVVNISRILEGKEIGTLFKA
ncbi:glutamate 5-kinase [Parablautia muri]|uniref:Glutamate 5-kinase n=1 Tax=Parablautia muri TaxID=2320879 RepID=A0A9X5BG23_9FIRM|nr:glutamate 5-kinase [Parablautia muri]NBJ92482.1 glutamate 5-kinase [Parablautia muri]